MHRFLLAASCLVLAGCAAGTTGSTSDADPTVAQLPPPPQTGTPGPSGGTPPVTTIPQSGTGVTTPPGF